MGYVGRAHHGYDCSVTSKTCSIRATSRIKGLTQGCVVVSQMLAVEPSLYNGEMMIIDIMRALQINDRTS